MTSPERKLRVLVLSRSYPSTVLPGLGLWVQRSVRAVAPGAQVTVISPVPYAPPLPRVGAARYYARFRDVPRRSSDGGVEVLHPRMVVGPGYSTHSAESASYAAAVLPVAALLRPRFSFDLIHAHFTYPDGVAAVLIGRLHGLPVVISEHVPWLPYMENYPLVRRQARWAARSCAALLPVSRYVAGTVARACHTPPGEAMPVPVDGEMFRLARGAHREERLLFVGAVRPAKGVDVLLEAFRRLAAHRPALRLMIAGEPYYASYRRETERLTERARALGIRERVDIVGHKPPPEVASLMASSAVVVLPSRVESFGSVLVEALACGTPVVATRSGGPEDIVTDELGRLVEPEDPVALADAVEDVIAASDGYAPEILRRRALARFGMEPIGRRLLDCYADVVRAHRLGARAVTVSQAARGPRAGRPTSAHLGARRGSATRGRRRRS